MKSHIPNPNPHVVKPVIRQAAGNREPKSAMDNSERVQVSPSAEEFAKQDSADERQCREQRAGDVGYGKKAGCGQYSTPGAKHRLQPQEEDALQNEFLRQ